MKKYIVLNHPKKSKYGIQITKPWSKEMYDHNDKVKEKALNAISEKLASAYSRAEHCSGVGSGDFLEEEWSYASTEELEDVQKAITYYSFGSGHTVGDVMKEIEKELEFGQYFRLKDIIETLGIKLKQDFIGLK